MNKQQMMKFVKQTIRTGNKKRIAEVLQRYYEVTSNNKLYNIAKEVFEK